MTVKQLRKEINNFATYLYRNKIAIHINPIIVKPISNTESILTWSSLEGFNSIHSVPFATIIDYKRIIENQQYNILLFDGSIIQILYKFRRNRIIRHSLSYYPCPIKLPDNLIELSDEGQLITDIFDTELYKAIDSIEWTYLTSQSYFTSSQDYNEENYTTNMKTYDPVLKMKTPFRFDYDPNTASTNHPGSHLHICIPNCRLPVFAALSFGHFIRFVFKNFYSTLWDDHSFLRNIASTTTNRSIDQTHETDLYINCR